MPDQSQSRAATGNLILDVLPDADYNRLRLSLEPIQLPLGEMLYQPQKLLEYVYFPINSMASVIAGTIGGQSAEVGVIGNEGIIGIEALMGVDLSTKLVLMQVSVSALRIKT
jgi:CRP-like cAMP-binding protein